MAAVAVRRQRSRHAGGRSRQVAHEADPRRRRDPDTGRAPGAGPARRRARRPGLPAHRETGRRRLGQGHSRRGRGLVAGRAGGLRAAQARALPAAGDRRGVPARARADGGAHRQHRRLGRAAAGRGQLSGRRRRPPSGVRLRGQVVGADAGRSAVPGAGRRRAAEGDRGAGDGDLRRAARPRLGTGRRAARRRRASLRARRQSAAWHHARRRRHLLLHARGLRRRPALRRPDPPPRRHRATAVSLRFLPVLPARADGVAMGESIRERILDLLRPTPAEWADWKWHFRHRITTAEALARIVPIAPDAVSRLAAVATKFPLSITPYYLALVRDGDPDDPILQQSMPDPRETALADLGEDDPLEESADSPVPGLVHRYPDRALLVVTDICPLLCRHCTREREWEFGNWVRRPSEIDAAVEYLRATPTIRDVIISGGDPLTLDNARLGDLLARLRSIPHLEIIRFGTRFPVVLPQRIDAEFCRLCDRYGPIWLNTHFNHPNEITPEAERAVRELLRAGVPVNNQTVLLRGINDTVEIQRRLSRELLRIRVRPYYLYHADEVRGTEHLRTQIGRASCRERVEAP